MLTKIRLNKDIEGGLYSAANSAMYSPRQIHIRLYNPIFIAAVRMVCNPIISAYRNRQC